ncbi:hypothetical protein ACGFJ7_26435 [Actinoplanes sp. NPDC048988]
MSTAPPVFSSGGDQVTSTVPSPVTLTATAVGAPGWLATSAAEAAASA